MGELLQDLVDSSVRLLDVDAAGVLLRVGTGLEVAASSTVDAHDLEVFQVEMHEGPCQECVTTGEPVTVDDLELRGRWPRFNEVAQRRGFKAVHSMPLRLRGEIIGALNLFHRRTYPWPPEDQAVARSLADIATIGIIQARAAADAEQLGSQLRHALDSRVLIEQAKGVVAQQAAVPVEEVFRLLRMYSRNHNVQLREVCRRVVARELSYEELSRTRSHLT